MPAPETPAPGYPVGGLASAVSVTDADWCKAISHHFENIDLGLDRDSVLSECCTEVYQPKASPKALGLPDNSNTDVIKLWLLGLWLVQTWCREYVVCMYVVSQLWRQRLDRLHRPMTKPHQVSWHIIIVPLSLPPSPCMSYSYSYKI